MDNSIRKMLDRYSLKSADNYENALKEIIQEIALLGLWRSKFFEKAAFYGGTALRLLYGLERFSEDIDFSLLEPDKEFNIDKYFSALKYEIESFGFEVNVERKDKTFNSNIESAFIKAGTIKNLLAVETPSAYLRNFGKTRLIKVKVEVDTDPPSGFETEARYLLNPIPFSVNTYKIPFLFAGKMHAILCRKWKTRVKGRDWYDFVWFVANNSKLNLAHLEKRMRQTGHLMRDDILSEKMFLELLNMQIDNTEFDKARSDVLPFLKDPAAAEIWSKAFFREIAGRIIYD